MHAILFPSQEIYLYPESLIAVKQELTRIPWKHRLVYNIIYIFLIVLHFRLP